VCPTFETPGDTVSATIRYLSAIALALVLCACSKTSETSSEVKQAASATDTAQAPKSQGTKKALGQEVPKSKGTPMDLAAAAKAFGDYRTQADTLVAEIKAKKPAAEIAQLATTLTNTGLSIAPIVATKFAACKEYIAAVIAAAPTMHTLPLEEIESGYHKDGKLPKNSQGECYHAKDLVVHPATVVALAKAGLGTPEGDAAAEAEIVEVLTHLGQLKTSLGLKE